MFLLSKKEFLELIALITWIELMFVKVKSLDFLFEKCFKA